MSPPVSVNVGWVGRGQQYLIRIKLTLKRLILKAPETGMNKNVEILHESIFVLLHKCKDLF